MRECRGRRSFADGWGGLAEFGLVCASSIVLCKWNSGRPSQVGVDRVILTLQI